MQERKKNMITQSEIEKVQQAMDSADPDGEDPELEAMQRAFRFVLGYEGTAEDFISMHVEEL
jgi:hypothetical protein